jgi:hypothetical protein
MVHSDPSAYSSESGIHGSKIDNLAGVAKMVEPNIPSFEEGNTLSETDLLKIVALIVNRYTSTPECNRIMSMERDKIMEFQGATRDFMRNPAVAETVKVKFIIKAMETYFPRMAQTLQNERESLESLNQRPDHTWVFRRPQELKLKTQEGGWFRAVENSSRRDSIMSISGGNKLHNRQLGSAERWIAGDANIVTS